VPGLSSIPTYAVPTWRPSPFQLLLVRAP